MAEVEKVTEEVKDDNTAVEEEAPAIAPDHTERMLTLLESILALVTPKAEPAPQESTEPIPSEKVEAEEEVEEWE